MPAEERAIIYGICTALLFIVLLLVLCCCASEYSASDQERIDMACTKSGGHITYEQNWSVFGGYYYISNIRCTHDS